MKRNRRQLEPGDLICSSRTDNWPLILFVDDLDEPGVMADDEALGLTAVGLVLAKPMYRAWAEEQLVPCMFEGKVGFVRLSMVSKCK
jgi:hypothetical protein